MNEGDWGGGWTQVLSYAAPVKFFFRKNGFFVKIMIHKINRFHRLELVWMRSNATLIAKGLGDIEHFIAFGLS